MYGRMGKFPRSCGCADMVCNVCVTVQVKQSRTRGGCAELDAAELRAKEQEAARAAAELLEQLEKEEAVRAAAKAAAGSASAKKKKKGGVHCDV